MEKDFNGISAQILNPSILNIPSIHYIGRFFFSLKSLKLETLLRVVHNGQLLTTGTYSFLHIKLKFNCTLYLILATWLLFSIEVAHSGNLTCKLYHRVYV